MNRIKRHVFGTLELTPDDDLPSKIFAVSITALIVLNVVAVILETESAVSSQYGSFLDILEVFSVTVFSVEYTLRVWTCTENARFGDPLFGRLRYISTPLALVDLLAILPFYLPMIIPFDLRFIRALRLFRLFRLFKMARYFAALSRLRTALVSKKEELLIVAFTVFVLLIIASSLMYFVENEAQPGAFSSILSAMWWAIITLTTIGYGDIYPITPIGRILGSVIAVLGIGVIALPAAILASSLVEVIKKDQQNSAICPHCGKDINEPAEIGADNAKEEIPNPVEKPLK